MTTPQLNNLGPNVKGRDFNFYQKAAITSSTFANIPDMKVTFTSQSVLFFNEGSGGTAVVEYSFNGNTVHGEMDPTKASASLTFNNRVISSIWFRIKAGSSGPVTVRVDAWSIP